MARKKFGFVDGQIWKIGGPTTPGGLWMKLTIDANVRTNLLHHDVA